MMEQGEEFNVKTLKERFQNDDSSKNRMKPAIPEKPKTVPPVSPTSKINNPLIASLNSAMENRMAPRVVFKDDKKTRQTPQPETSLVKAKPIMLDKNQKKEADLIMQALRDKKIRPTSPPAVDQTPKYASVQKSPGLETPASVSPPWKMILNKTDENDNDKSHHFEWDIPTTPPLDYSDSTISTPFKTEATVYNKPVVPNVLGSPIRNLANPTISAPVMSPSPTSVSKPPVLAVQNPVSPNGPQMEIPTPENPIRMNSSVTSPTADRFAHGLPKKAISSPDIIDILHMDIPPPVIPEDFADGSMSVPEISANVAPEPSFPRASVSVTPVSRRLGQSDIASSVPSTSTPGSDSAFTFSPLPAFVSPVESMAEIRSTESRPVFDYTEKPLDLPVSSSPKAVSVVSALARAEEMTPVKHNPCDQRLFALLEKSKRKTAVTSQASKPDIPPVFETDLPSNEVLEVSPPETAHAEPFTHVSAPNGPETLVTLPNIPPVDYQGKAAVASLDGQNHRKSSPNSKLVTVQKPAMPPPPPPRKPQVTVPNGGLTPEKPIEVPHSNIESTVLPSQPLLQNPTGYINHSTNGIIIPAPGDFTSPVSVNKDSDIFDASKIAALQAPQEEAFSGHLNLDHQTPSMDITDAGPPRTFLPTPIDYSDSVPSSPFSPSIPISPSGKSVISTDFEDLAINKKSKMPKKIRKGSPLNPYAESSVLADETPKKAMLSKKNSVSDEKGLKVKEKQKQKDQEKEKKELKEKEKKELKEKEKEQKEKKEKEKDKKKEQKDKEKDKKELKEKEREKKEQKEKEKKENEIKKKFKINGDEEALYQAKVTETIKGRKDDLPIKAGEIVSIIRTTDCPKGKWLARDSTNKYGYIPLESVEMDVQEMMVLGNKAKANNNRPKINGIIDSEIPRTDNIPQHHYNLHQESFEDDSEEWGDDDDTVFTPTHPTNLELNRSMASPGIGSKPVPVLPTYTDQRDNANAGNEALHKLTTFFAQPTVPTLQNNTPIKEPKPLAVRAEEPDSSLKQEADLQFLPPPDLYADIVLG